MYRNKCIYFFVCSLTSEKSNDQSHSNFKSI